MHSNDIINRFIVGGMVPINFFLWLMCGGDRIKKGIGRLGGNAPLTAIHGDTFLFNILLVLSM